MKYSFLGMGALFGFILSRAGATTYDYYAQLFLFQDLQLMVVIAVAALVGMVGVQLIRRFNVKVVTSGEPVSFKPKPMTKGLVGGSLMFGVGWGLAGACPGTALAMLGEGRMAAGFTIFGIVLGTWLYGARAPVVDPVTASVGTSV